MIKFVLNGWLVEVDNFLDEMLFFVIWDMMNLKGMKYGCGVVMCGVCIVYVNGGVVFLC